MSRAHARLHRRRWSRVRRVVLERDGWRCCACGRAGRLEVDHVVPLHVAPGQNPYEPDGLQALCRACHILKTAAENARPITPEQLAWQHLVSELLEA